MHTKIPHYFTLYNVLEDTARYAGLLLAPAEALAFGQGFSCPSDKKRAYYAVLAHFWQFLVSNGTLGNFHCTSSSHPNLVVWLHLNEAAHHLDCLTSQNLGDHSN